MLHVTYMIIILLIFLFLNTQGIFGTIVDPMIEIVAKLYQNNNIFQEFSLVNIAFIIIILIMLPRIIQISLLFLDILMVIAAIIGTLTMVLFGITSCLYNRIKKILS